MHYLTSEYATSNFAKNNNEDSFFAHYCEKITAKELVKPYNHKYIGRNGNNRGIMINNGNNRGVAINNGGGRKSGSSMSTQPPSCLLPNRSIAATFAVEVPCSDINHTVNWLRATTQRIGVGAGTGVGVGVEVGANNHSSMLLPVSPLSPSPSIDNPSTNIDTLSPRVDTPLGLHSTWAYISPHVTLLLLRKSISIDGIDDRTLPVRTS